MLRQKHKAPLSIKSPEPRAKGDVDIKGGNYGKGLNKQDVNLTDRLLAGTGCFDTMISTKKGVRAAARWMVRADALHQFSLARVQARRVDGHEEQVYE